MLYMTRILVIRERSDADGHSGGSKNPAERAAG